MNYQITLAESARLYLAAISALSCEEGENPRAIYLREYARILSFASPESVARLVGHATALSDHLESETYGKNAEYWQIPAKNVRDHLGNAEYAKSVMGLCGGRKTVRGWTNAPMDFGGFVAELNEKLPDYLNPDHVDS